MTKDATKSPCCTKRLYEITSADLPLSCPPRNERVWDGHPRVYLPIDEVGKVVCPYCDATYVLTDFALLNHSPLAKEGRVDD